MGCDIKDLSGIVRQTAFTLHCYLKYGHLEKVYENGLAHRLRKLGLRVETQHALKVFDEDGVVLGDYFADMYIEDCLIAEIKSVKQIIPEHIAQLFGYMRASRIEHGLLINFGAPRFESHKYILTPVRDSLVKEED